MGSASANFLCSPVWVPSGLLSISPPRQQQENCVLQFDTFLHEKDLWKILLISCNELKPEDHGTAHCTSPLENLYMRKEREVTYYVHEIPLVRNFCLETGHFG